MSEIGFEAFLAALAITIVVPVAMTFLWALLEGDGQPGPGDRRRAREGRSKAEMEDWVWERWEGHR